MTAVVALEIVVMVVGLLLTLAPSQFIAQPGVREFSNQLIARPLSSAHRARAVALLGEFPVVDHVPQTDEYVIAVLPGQENQVAEQLLRRGDFAYVEPNWIVYPIGCSNDPSLAAQWHHAADRMQSCDAWSRATGLPTVGVGICDTGIRVTHEDLLLNRREGYNAVDRLWESQGGDISPVHPHGTNTTGCAAANGDNSKGVAGVGWNLAHRMLRVSNLSSGSSDLATLQHAARTAIENGDRVASVSYSGADSASNLTTASYIKSIGGLLVWAAGNDGRRLTLDDRDQDDLIVVGGTDEADARASFSAFGPFVDVMAPAVNVLTTDALANTAYAAVSGTSFACPLTAGLCALLWSAAPSATPDEIEHMLKTGCTDLGATGVDDLFAHGRIDSMRSLALVRAVAFEYPNPLPDLVHPGGGTTLRVVIANAGADPVSAVLHYDAGQGWQSVPMAEVAPDNYDAVFANLPGRPCGSLVTYYVSVLASDGQTYTDPAAAPADSFQATAAATAETLVQLDFESAPGWTVENLDLLDGPWDRGVPVGGGDRGDPAADFDHSGQCWLTDNVDGNSDVDGGPTRLVSPVFNLSGRLNAVVSYARWFTNSLADADRLAIEVSGNGGVTWSLLESVANSGRWTVARSRVAEVIAPTSEFRIRFSVADNPNDSVDEAAIDRFQLVDYRCPLLLDASPNTVALGQQLVLTTWNGLPTAPVGLFITRVNGIPLTRRLKITTFDDAGVWTLAFIVPDDPALSGLDIEFTSFGIGASGEVEATNGEHVVTP